MGRSLVERLKKARPLRSSSRSSQRSNTVSSPSDSATRGSTAIANQPNQPNQTQQQSAVAAVQQVSSSATAPQTNDRGSMLWNEALKSLPHEDQKTISATPKPLSKLELLENMLDAAVDKQEECNRRKWKFTLNGREIVLADHAASVIQWLKKFKEVGDVAVNYDPVHAALPWAGIRFLLQVREISKIIFLYSCE